MTNQPNSYIKGFKRSDFIFSPPIRRQAPDKDYPGNLLTHVGIHIESNCLYMCILVHPEHKNSRSYDTLSEASLFHIAPIRYIDTMREHAILIAADYGAKIDFEPYHENTIFVFERTSKGDIFCSNTYSEHKCIMTILTKPNQPFQLQGHEDFDKLSVLFTKQTQKK